MKTTPFQFGYTPALDGMRGVAITAVIIFHATAGGLGQSFLNGGFIGVDVFFVLSGFLITALLLREYDTTQRISLKNFYMRRILRLLPALTALLIIFNLYSFTFLDHQRAITNLRDSFIALFYMANWTRAFEMGMPDTLGHTWSLSIEEQFYIIWPLIILVFTALFRSRKALAYTTVVLIALSCCLRIYLFRHGASAMRLYNGLDTRADCLLVGCFLAIVMSPALIHSITTSRFLTICLRFSAIASAAALLLIAKLTTWWMPSMYYWIFLAIEACSAILILSIFSFPRGRITLFFENKALVWLGSISYGLYLWHYPIFEIMRLNNQPKMLILTVGTMLALAASSLSFYFLERPLLRLKKRFSSAATARTPGLPHGE